MYKLSIPLLGIAQLDLMKIFGNNNEHILRVENVFECVINLRDNQIVIDCENDNGGEVKEIILKLLEYVKKGYEIDDVVVKNIIESIREQKIYDLDRFEEFAIIQTYKNKVIKAKTKNQHEYIKNILAADIVFGIGPAGTGKTFLAVAMALRLLKSKHVEKIIITRPAVEAGENLGFLPGDLKEKVDPYLQPIYDSLYMMIGVDLTTKLIEKKVIEIAPQAYMRGRTLQNSFVILDEAQNTTAQQMKMFVTRLGKNSKMIITGDISQIDLHHNEKSGLIDVLEVTKNIHEIRSTQFSSTDVMRHDLVAKIIDSYEKASKK